MNGGGLENIMSLLGETRHRKFRSKNLDSSVSKKTEWGKLFTFLKEELNLREKMVLDIKSARLMGIELKPEKSKDGGGDKKNLLVGQILFLQLQECQSAIFVEKVGILLL